VSAPLIDGRCWGVGATSIGRQHPQDFYRCDGCHRKLRKSESPLRFLERVFCLDCARRRHVGCICAWDSWLVKWEPT
jgi:hypothetical protein